MCNPSTGQVLTLHMVPVSHLIHKFSYIHVDYIHDDTLVLLLTDVVWTRAAVILHISCGTRKEPDAHLRVRHKV